MQNIYMNDIDPEETNEWIEALRNILINDGNKRAEFILQKLIKEAKLQGINIKSLFNTPYKNTISFDKEKIMPEDYGMQERINSLIRWNALIMVLRVSKKFPELGGHISSYASALTLYEVGFNYFFKGPNSNSCGGDLLYIQGHSAPGIYARAYLEGRLSEYQLNNFRQEVNSDGLSSYPHPWLMPNFWQFPTVSMGLSSIQSIYQARFLRYLNNRGLLKDNNRKVWVFLGDGEMDEPESIGALSIASREKLDNLIFVINCNLQRLDGLVRGNGKIIQELESIFHGFGWNVIKVIWGSKWDNLINSDKEGLLQKRMEECLDGDYQNYKANNGSYIRKHFFGKYLGLLKMVENMSDYDIEHLNRGGHDAQKVYAAYFEAVNHKGSPTVILAKTVKGYGVGLGIEGQNIAHQQKEISIDQLKIFKKRFNIPITDKQLKELSFYRPDDKSPEIIYLKKQRDALGGYLPYRNRISYKLKIPNLSIFSSLVSKSSTIKFSTTMAFLKILFALLNDKLINNHIVPIIPDECRTFGIEGLFKKIGIYSHCGQLYNSIDKKQLIFYKETQNGQILEEGINEAGAFCSWIAAATSYSTNKVPMIPFYIYYSMFGFQRIGDLIWAAGDMRARGFLIGGTSGKTTLAGEGLQHQDGHSHILFSTIPNCITYNPAYSYELAVIIQNGLFRMYENQEDIFYYITIMNESYIHPCMPIGVQDDIIKGMYLLKESIPNDERHVQLLGSGSIMQEVINASVLLKNDFLITSDLWSVTSFNELRKDGLLTERFNRLNPKLKKPKLTFIEKKLNNRKGPIVAVTDYMHIYADQVSKFISKTFVSLGTDGYGRSDTRINLRCFFEINSKFIVLSALSALNKDKIIHSTEIEKAIHMYKINFYKTNPFFD
ncbi:pyruvate dehydrogenase (acetyl-transferring), homodimeric type [Candidatus Legionella polyplacis]|uniref:pyruvate dehydrogenase (acetyl-transferring), homodimeric type n=1 Tax=Candidatus Legionella polyplacis TaxID=2005262 RepID=UPI000C1F4005|nr:pyruvate dehydrogenase (acetyl-transferring), homodimeric type [Candidatus Legionella polyplacis]ATW01662.1 pyruvate dehydrogenase (acetyl-transferring), homodimeric type [Candidatus Legionella polyplacis]